MPFERLPRGPILASILTEQLLASDTLTATPSPPLSGEAQVPGDKSISHRALILGALAAGETRINGLLESDDVLATSSAVEALGAAVERREPGKWRVEGRTWRSPDGPIDCANSATAARLLMGAAAGFPITASFTGDESLRRRPMDRLLEPLAAMGAEVLRSAGGRLPATVRGGRLKGIHYRNDIGSAQVKSAILLAGLRANGEVAVEEPRPTRNHTETMLRDFGCEVDFGPGFVRLGERRELKGTSVDVPGDPSSAAFPLVAALLVPGSRVRVASILLGPLRTAFLDILAEMGADLRIERQGPETGAVEASHSRLSGIEVPADRVPATIDEYPILAVAAAFAEGRTVMRGLSELRVKESDRLGSIVDALQACGVKAMAKCDDLIIHGCGGRPAGGARVDARGDHRIAMSMLVLGLGARSPVTVGSASAIRTSFPDFTRTMRALGADIR